MSEFESPGISKSGAEVNVTIPLEEPIANTSASLPEEMLNVRESPSASDAVAVKAVV